PPARAAGPSTAAAMSATAPSAISTTPLIACPSIDDGPDESSHRAVRVLRAGCYGAVSISFGAASSRRRGHLPNAIQREGGSETHLVARPGGARRDNAAGGA